MIILSHPVSAANTEKKISLFTCDVSRTSSATLGLSFIYKTSYPCGLIGVVKVFGTENICSSGNAILGTRT